MNRLLERDAGRVGDWLRTESLECPEYVLISIKRLSVCAAESPAYGALLDAAIGRYQLEGVVSRADISRCSLLPPHGEVVGIAPLEVSLRRESKVHTTGATKAKDAVLPVTQPSSSSTGGESSADVALEIQSILRSVKQSVESITSAISEEGSVLSENEAVITRTVDKTHQQSSALDKLDGGTKRPTSAFGGLLRRILPAPVAYTINSYIDGMVAIIASALWTVIVLMLVVSGMAVVLWFPKY